MIQSKLMISGNSDLLRIAFIAIVDYAVQACTAENVKKAISATGVIPFNPKKINLSNFSAGRVENETPILNSYTCSECRVKNVEFHPLIRQGEIPVRLANVFVYTPPPKKTKTKSKIVEKARVITSEKVRTEVASVEETKREKERAKRKSASGVVNPSFKCNTSFKYSHSGKGKKKLKKVGGASKSEEVEQDSSKQNTSFDARDYVKVIKMPYKERILCYSHRS